tara:strand:+ start:228 stop:1052 length:825 start_codon:yes stop_codon:yes gene_type:complete
MISRNSRKFKKYANNYKNNNTEFNKFDILLILLLSIYFYHYLFKVFYLAFSFVYQISAFLFEIILAIKKVNNVKGIHNSTKFNGVITDLTHFQNHEMKSLLINTMRPNYHCELGIDHNVTMKVIYDIKMLQDDTVSNIQKILKLFDDMYSVNEVNNNLKDHTLTTSWYKIPNLSKFKYKIGIHKNKIRRMMEVTDIFVKLLTKKGDIYVNFAYVKFDIIGNHETKFNKELYNKLNPIIIERNEQYIESLCLTKKSEIKNVDFNTKFASFFETNL